MGTGFEPDATGDIPQLVSIRIDHLAINEELQLVASLRHRIDEAHKPGAFHRRVLSS